MSTTIIQSGFESRAIKMEPLWQVTYQAPIEDIDRIFEAITTVVPLVQGKTDRNGFRSASGQEYYRPLEGTPTGGEEDTRKRPNVDEMSFFIPRDEQALDKVIESIYAVHSYYEPVIVVKEVLRSVCKGLDDADNPHRWWNKDGDWKAKS